MHNIATNVLYCAMFWVLTIAGLIIALYAFAAINLRIGYSRLL